MLRIALPARHLLSELRRRSVFKVGAAWLVTGWLLIQVASTVVPQFDLPTWMPRIVTVVVMLGFPVALVLAWAFEITPEGIERDARSRNTRFVVAVACVLAVAAVGWFFRAELAGRATAGERTIAVLPFINLGTDADSEVLADGLAEELLGTLGRNPSFRVTARSSAFQFKGQNRDLREIGQRLGVRYILEGSVRMAGNRVRIGAQLVDTADGSQRWSESYDRTVADLFAMERDIAYEVESALQVLLVASEERAPRGTAIVEAHMELLRGLQSAASRVVEDLDVAIAHLQRAITLDQEYSRAYVELAYAVYTRALQLGEENSIEPVIAPLIEKALALDPQSGEALALRGSTMVDDPVLAESTIRAGLALSPSHARGYEMLANTLLNDPARVDEALAVLEQAIALDPLSPRNHHMMGILFWQYKGDQEAASGHFRRALELEPRFQNALRFLVITSMMTGEMAAAVDYEERLTKLRPDDQAERDFLVVQLLNIGDPDGARAAAVDASGPVQIAILAFDGEIDAAMARLRALPDLPPGDLVGDVVVPPLLLRHASTHDTWAADVELAMRRFDGTLIEDADSPALAYPHWVALLRGAGRHAEAEQLERDALARLDRLDRRQLRGSQAMLDWQRAMLYAGAGRNAAALEVLERVFEVPRPFWWVLLEGDPLFAPLQSDPKFIALRDRLEQQLAGQRALLDGLRRDRRVDGADGTDHP